MTKPDLSVRETQLCLTVINVIHILDPFLIT